MGLFDKVKKGVDAITQTPAKPAAPAQPAAPAAKPAAPARPAVQARPAAPARPAAAAKPPPPPVEEEEEQEEEVEEESDDEGREGMSIGNSSGYEKYLNAPPYFGKLDKNKLEDYFFQKFELEDAEMNDNLDQKLSELGLSGKEEWWKIEASFYRQHFGRMTEEQAQAAYLKAAAQARQRQVMRAQQKAVAGDPTLTAPVEGVTVEGWAKAASTMAKITDMAQQAKALAALGMDRAKYDRVNNEYQARMQRDTTFAIATIYGQAFSAAQGVSGGYGFGNEDGSAQKLGKEPVTFERYSEIAGAQAAWGQSGADVNANLKSVFGISAIDISNYGAYWATKFAADPTLAIKHVELMEQYKSKYMTGGGQDEDMDI